MINVFDLLLLDNSPLQAQRSRFAVRTRPGGLVSGNATFSPADLARASRCLAVYHVIAAGRGLPALFERAWRRQGRPSAVLERLAGEALRAGLLPRKRLIIDSPGSTGALTPAFVRAGLARLCGAAGGAS